MNYINIPSTQEIIRVLRGAGREPQQARELARKMGVSADSYRAFRRRLRDMEHDGIVVRYRGGGYGLPRRFAQVEGRLKRISSGDGFVVREEEGAEDVFVPSRHLGSAVTGDLVAVHIHRRRRGRNPEGRVARVLRRGATQVVGLFRSRARHGVVTAQEPPLQVDIFVPATELGKAADGDVVLVHVHEWGAHEPRPVGTVVDVLGRPGDPGLDVLSILLGHQLPRAFPEQVTREAERIAERGVRAEDIARREDLRDRPAFTIDPAEARDHDDALSLARLADGSLEVGVHIADVAFYVKPGSAVDREARDRATSVYLVDRVVPMLPEPLSGDLCSLVAGKDRLTISVLFRYDEAGRLLDHRLARSVISCRRQLSYDEAQELLDGVETDVAGSGSGDLRAGEPLTDEALARALFTLRSLCRGVRERREGKGAIDFAIPEAEVRLDASGRPLSIRPRPRLDTHRMVEDLMILANETIATLGEREGLPLIYRVHEAPGEARLDALREVAAILGHPLPRKPIEARDIASLLDGTRDTPQAYLIAAVALRSMKRARYGARNVGHYGLGLPSYLHFTSPIRRYPDLVVQRAVAGWIRDPSAQRGPGVDELEAVAEHSSQRELRAESASRASLEAKQVEYMRRHLGDECSGTISGVTGHGLYVLLDESLAEGLVRLDSLQDDYYRWDQRAHAIIGRRHRRRLRLGDRVTVQIVRVDSERRRVDLELRPSPLDRRGGDG